jgi:hypothetical protein
MNAEPSTLSSAQAVLVSPCVVKYAGQALTTGKQAECYANEFIALQSSLPVTKHPPTRP